ncbi:MAG TPA: hypothetical protein VGJ13_06770 [Pseudonocardiaceae bacterium]
MLTRYDRNPYHGFATSERVFFLFRPWDGREVAADEGSPPRR